MPDERSTLLIVRHPNLCRSPMADRLVRHALGKRLDDPASVIVSSVGVRAGAGLPMHAHTGAVPREYGADVTHFRSRPVSPEMVMAADLVLTATRSQRAECVTMAPQTVGRAFTLLQFGRLAAALGPDALNGSPARRLRALID